MCCVLIVTSASQKSLLSVVPYRKISVGDKGTRRRAKTRTTVPGTPPSCSNLCLARPVRSDERRSPSPSRRVSATQASNITDCGSLNRLQQCSYGRKGKKDRQQESICQSWPPELHLLTAPYSSNRAAALYTAHNGPSTPPRHVPYKRSTAADPPCSRSPSARTFNASAPPSQPPSPSPTSPRKRQSDTMFPRSRQPARPKSS